MTYKAIVERMIEIEATRFVEKTLEKTMFLIVLQRLGKPRWKMTKRQTQSIGM